MVLDVKIDSTRSSYADHTMLYKSCVKTLRARKKASGITLPPSRIFPGSISIESSKSVSTDTNSSGNNDSVEKKTQSLQTAQFFQRARKIHDEISRHKQLLHDHRGRYLGQINDSSSMTQEQCVCMDKIISNNLTTVEKQIADLESKISPSLLQIVKKATNSLTRPGDPGSNGIPVSLAAGASDSTNGHDCKPKNSDVEWCMAITVAIVRASLADLNTIFAAMKQTRSHKQSVKAKLMRLQRPSCVEKDSTVRLRQQQQTAKQDSDSDSSHGPGPTNNRKKVQFEDWRDDEDIHLVNGLAKNAECDNSQHAGAKAKSNSTAGSSKTYPSTDSDDDMERQSGGTRSRFNDEETGSSRLAGDQTLSYQDSSAFNTNGSDASLAALSDEECQMLEQENDQLYNELQSTHEEVKQMTKQVAELGRLQDLLTENVEEQAVMADSVQNLVVTATDNVQEGNEQIREAMRKDASFRVWIMFFLIVMSFTILFLDWYND